ncbi:MAG: type II toxin-antitoxin system Phd/YefM family antitoxin [Cyanobacteria bacterium P01_D01_bin.123]
MPAISLGNAKRSFADIFNQVATAAEHVAIQQPEQDPVYVIPAKDYELFQSLLPQAEDASDLQIPEERMSNPNAKRIVFDEFLAALKHSRE